MCGKTDQAVSVGWLTGSTDADADASLARLYIALQPS